MQATTIKLENPLLSDLVHLKPKGKSITAFVRELIEREIRRQRMIDAAEKYSSFLQSYPEETLWMEEWESADLASSPKRKREIKK